MFSTRIPRSAVTRPRVQEASERRLGERIDGDDGDFVSVLTTGDLLRTARADDAAPRRSGSVVDGASRGSTALPDDFDIFTPSDVRTRPWMTTSANGACPVQKITVDPLPQEPRRVELGRVCRNHVAQAEIARLEQEYGPAPDPLSGTWRIAIEPGGLEGRMVLALEGTLHLPEGDVPVTGNAWLDREWSSQPLSENQTGWDWFSLSFDDGNKLMGFRLQQTDGNNFTAATWITPEGATTPFPDGAFQAEPLATNASDVPVRWQVRLPDRGVDVTVTAINPDAWMATSVPYWEGPVTISGSHAGVGYLEMTGYD